MIRKIVFNIMFVKHKNNKVCVKTDGIIRSLFKRERILDTGIRTVVTQFQCVCVRIIRKALYIKILQ